MLPGVLLNKISSVTICFSHKQSSGDIILVVEIWLKIDIVVKSIEY